MKKRNPNTCVRINRDETQIRRGQLLLNALDESVERLIKRLTLASNKVRFQMLLLLAEEHSLCVCDLAEILQMTVPAVSQHLKKLKEGGLVIAEQDGVTVYYHLSASAKPFVESLLGILGPRTARSRAVGQAKK